MNRDVFRSMVKWFGLLLLFHLMSMILFGLLFSSSVAQMVDDKLQPRANATILIYDIVVFVIFSVVFSKIESSFSEYKKGIKDRVRENKFSVVEYFKQNFLKEHLIRLGIYFAFQLPFLVFCLVFGVELQYPTMFEQFYIAETGFYLATGSALLGLLLNTVVFGMIFSLIRILFVFITKKDVEKDIMH